MESLRPSKFSACGFMGDDPRNLEEVISDDASTMERLGRSRQDIVQTLNKIFKAAESKLGDPVPIAKDLIAEYIPCRGKIPSPFPGEGAFAKNMVQVTSNHGNVKFYITPLSIHLIDKHGFFQGKGSPFRLEPEYIASLSEKKSTK
ncbi:MAG: hypothetical protein ABR533_06200 [Desulfonatronovibrio sp.]